MAFTAQTGREQQNKTIMVMVKYLTPNNRNISNA